MELESDKVNIVDSLKKQAYCSICCIIWFTALMVMVSIMLFDSIPSPSNIVAIIIIWGIMTPFLIWVVLYLEGTTKERTFFISNEIIEINVPPRSPFKLNWSDIESIKVKKYIIREVPYAHHARSTIFELSFNQKDGEKVYKINRGKDFHGKKLKYILELLETFANKMEKTYKGHKKKK